jgi:hypothetical protein
MIFLSGGPSHLDLYDMKPEAPAEYRGEFRPIRTNVPGIDICELMPRQAKIADKFTILRGCQLTHLHTANEFYSGYGWQEQPRASVPGEARRPALGSVVSRIRGTHDGVPPYVSIHNNLDWERAYYLGQEHEPFRAGKAEAPEPLANMRKPRDLNDERLQCRFQMLQDLDLFRREADASGFIKGADAFQARAFDIVRSGRIHDAFQIDREPESVRAAYGEQPSHLIRQECVNPGTHEIAHPGKALLQARRLVEAGVSVVTVCLHHWDTHRYNFTSLRTMVPPLDQAISALILDLEDRGMLGDVAVLMGGEFGRTPRIGDVTPDGRSHWPEAGFLWVAGGGLKTGQVIGGTDSRGERVIGNPIRMQHVLTTLYHTLGIDPSTTFRDHNGRPQYVLEDREPIAALL